MDNLDLAVLSLSIDSRQYRQRLETVFGLFSVLDERRNQRAGTMSGGQQRMLSIGMALMQAPKLLLLDEPSLGLSPILIEEIFGVIRSSRDRLGLSILLVEQNVKYAMHLADSVCILKMGEVVCAGEPGVLLNQINLWDKL